MPIPAKNILTVTYNPLCKHTARLVALFIESKTVPAHKIKEMVKLIRDEAYAKGYDPNSDLVK